jgi:hypothetical protein
MDDFLGQTARSQRRSFQNAVSSSNAAEIR